MVEARLNPRQSGSSARDFAHRGRLPLSEGSRPFEQRQSDLERKGSVWEDLAVLLDGGMCCVKVKQRLKGAMYMELVTIPSSNQCSLSFYLAPGTPMGTGRHSHKPVFQKQHENKQMDTKGGTVAGGGGVMIWEIGIDMYTLMCIKWMTNKNLLYKKIDKIQKFKKKKA